MNQSHVSPRDCLHLAICLKHRDGQPGDVEYILENTRVRQPDLRFSRVPMQSAGLDAFPALTK
jgi:hypothetical protein